MDKTRTIYRDSVTGRFASKSTWKRSKSHDGTRYKRQRIKEKKRKAPPPPIPPPIPPPEAPVFEWLVTFTYDKSGRSFDVIVTAREETGAVQVARQFLRDDPDAQRMAKAGFHGYSVVPARGKATDLDAGEAEYRKDSREDQTRDKIEWRRRRWLRGEKGTAE